MMVRNLEYIVDVIGSIICDFNRNNNSRINTESRDRGGGGAGFLLGLIF